MEDTHVHALDYLSVVRRRKWWLIMPIVASIAIGYALVRFLPKQYKGTVTLGVVAPGVSPNLVGQSAPLDNAERMLILRARLKSNRWRELEADISSPIAAAGPRRLLPRERTRTAA